MTTKPEPINPNVTRHLPNKADPGVDHSTVAKPGGLRGGASLVVQTRQAQRLIYGRGEQQDKPAIIGLVQFGMLMRRIWTSAMLDDPYADWYLLRVLDCLEEARSEIRSLHQNTNQRLEAMPGIEITVAQSASPVRVPLHFANPYGYMGSYLIADCDDLVRAILTARHVGLISRDHGEQMIHRGARQVRRAFALPSGWRHLAINREDLRQNNQRAQQAREKMGELPEDILEGTRRSKIAPEIRKPSPGRQSERDAFKISPNSE